jgi:hypothetical protein
MLSSIALRAQVEPGIALAYGFDVKNIGIEGRLQIAMTGIENIRLVPAVTWFFTSNYQFFTADVNLQYMLLNTEQGGRAWVLGGLDVARTSVGQGTTNIGANIGIGASGDTGLINPFAELKYGFGNAKQVVLTLGMFF